MAGYHWGIRFNYRNAPEFILLCTRVRRLYVWTCSTKKERPLWCSRTTPRIFLWRGNGGRRSDRLFTTPLHGTRELVKSLKERALCSRRLLYSILPSWRVFSFFLFPFAISIYLQGPALCARVYKSHFLFCHCRLETSPTFCRWCVFVCVYLSSFGCIAR